LVFLFVPRPTTTEAWQWVIKRSPRCLDWDRDDIEGMIPDEQLERVAETLGNITEQELMRFAIGEDGLDDRPVQGGDVSLAITDGTEPVPASCRADFLLTFVDAETASSTQGGNEIRIPVSNTGFLLDGLRRVAVKVVLNALSTCVMVRLGRVMGNTMIYVVPSNLKLIDRATRYISRLTGKDYVEANQLLFGAVEYVEPRMLAGQAYPPVVGLTVLKVRDGLTHEAAEQVLAEGLAGT
jgi:hypothetical protein